MELDVCVGSQSSIHGTLKSLKKEHGLFKVSEDISPHQKATKMHRKKSQIPTREKQNDKPNNIAIGYVAGLFKKLRRIFSMTSPCTSDPATPLDKNVLSTQKQNSQI